MSFENGSTFFLFRGDTPLGHSVDITTSFSLDLPESTTKSSGGFKEVISGVKSGKIQVSGFIAYDDTLNFEEFSDMILQRTTAEFFMKQNVGIIVQGFAFVENVEQTADAETGVQYDFDLTLSEDILVFDNSDPTGELIWSLADLVWNTTNVDWNLV